MLITSNTGSFGSAVKTGYTQVSDEVKRLQPLPISFTQNLQEVTMKARKFERRLRWKGGYALPLVAVLTMLFAGQVEAAPIQ